LTAARAGRLLLRNARIADDAAGAAVDVVVDAARVAAVAPVGGSPAAEAEIDVEGRWVRPGIVNAHDHLDFSTLPDLGGGPYANAYEWAAALGQRQKDAAVQSALRVPLTDRLFLGGLRNLLAGATAVAHHGPYHRSLGAPAFPVRVLARYQFAHSPGLTPALRRTYRTTDRRIPWFAHVGEGTDARARGELDRLVRENVLRQNTVIIHGIALPAETLPAVAEARASVVWCPEANRRLYGATADVAALRAARVRIGLGSDVPAAGVRDPLSNLAAARREAVLTDAELLALATTGSAEVARLPAGGLAPGALADLIVAESRDRLLSGDRTAIALVLVGGQARFGREDWMRRLDPASRPVGVDGQPRALGAATFRRAASLVRAHPAVRAPEWAAGLDVGSTFR
jgi:cytosine/adenosine deaminase-related metal-dependent hydrolase